MRTIWMAVAIALCSTACGDTSSPATGPETSPAPLAEAGAGTAPAIAYERATLALSQSRMLSPAGDNAVEHYLEARGAAAERVRAQTALAELQPYVLIAAEQAIARGDVAEASRLRGLIERIDAQAPALPRLRADVAALMGEQAAREAAAADSAPLPPVAPAIARTEAQSSAASAPAMMAAPSPESLPPARPPSASTVAGEDVPRSPASSAPEPAPVNRVGQQDTRIPRMLQDAQPRYPLPALRARIEGQAEVAFTIQPDGSVRDVRLLSSTPAGMFDASALAVAQRWRFEATGQAHASSRTIRFRLPPDEARGG